jgi:DNA-binding PadR family transcriptional regulator
LSAPHASSSSSFSLSSKCSIGLLTSSVEEYDAERINIYQLSRKINRKINKRLKGEQQTVELIEKFESQSKKENSLINFPSFYVTAQYN